MTTLAQAAATAMEAEKTALAATCRTALGTWSGSVIDPALLTVSHVDVLARMVVLTDTAGVSLAVYADDSKVWLVDGSGTTWTRKTGPLASLAALGVALGSS